MASYQLQHERSVSSWRRCRPRSRAHGQSSTTVHVAPETRPTAPLDAELWNATAGYRAAQPAVGIGTAWLGRPSTEVDIHPGQHSRRKRIQRRIRRRRPGPDARWDIKVGQGGETEGRAVAASSGLLVITSPRPYYGPDGSWPEPGTAKVSRRGSGCESDHETEGEWAWLDNPFSNTRAFQRLIAIDLLLSNWDFKTSKPRLRHDGSRWPDRRYVVQDLGAAFGKPRLARSNKLLALLPGRVGTRNDIDDFEETKLIRDIKGSEVTLDYRGAAGEILETMNVADVIWACELIDRLQDGQLDDAFEAAGDDTATRVRYITKIRVKIGEGLVLRNARLSTGDRDELSSCCCLRRTSASDGGRRAAVLADRAPCGTGGCAAQPAAQATQPSAPATAGEPFEAQELLEDFRTGLGHAAVRLPIAALFGTALRFGRGAPDRHVAMPQSSKRRSCWRSSAR